MGVNNGSKELLLGHFGSEHSELFSILVDVVVFPSLTKKVVQVAESTVAVEILFVLLILWKVWLLAIFCKSTRSLLLYRDGV